LWSNYSSGDYRKFTITPSPQGAGQARVYGFAKSGSWSGNTYAWKVKYFVGNDDGTTYNTGIEGSVSRAVTSWGTSWSNSGKLTVTANPQGQSTAYGLVDHGGSWSDGTFTGKVYYYENNDDEHSWDTHFRYTVTNVVDSWSRTPFAADTTTRAYKQLSIPVSVNVNGKTYSNTFTTPNITLVKQGEAVVDVKCGTTTIARLVLYDD